jgi:hypothetical protein
VKSGNNMEINLKIRKERVKSAGCCPDFVKISRLDRR